MTNVTVSPSPHISGKDSVNSIMYGVIVALVPALLVSLYSFGVGALIVSLTAVVACLLFEYLIQTYLLKQKATISDGSAALTGLLLAFNVPSNLPIWMLLIGCLVAIGIAKMSFGGLGNNIFNPALVGRVFLLMSFPSNMTTWPLPMVNRMQLFDATTGATPLALLKEGLMSGATITSMQSSLPSYVELATGTVGGSLGEVSAIALLIGGAYMLARKIITWHIPVSVIGTMLLLSGILWLIDPGHYADPLFHLFTGGVLLGALFMATDMVTSPMSAWGQIVFGVGIGLLTIIIRTFGAYPEGMSFAILIMNAFVPLINTYIKPKRFGH